MNLNSGFEIEKSPETLVKFVHQIQMLADQERNALGFWPKQQLLEAIQRRRLWVILNAGQFSGYLIYSGVFPHAKIQAIAVINEARKFGVAACLLRALISELERNGYISIKAEVASDLDSALHFYQVCGFEISHIKPGGRSRKRKIVVHTLELDTESLFSALDRKVEIIDLGIRRRSASEAPFYAFDLNVYLDLAKDREQSENARKLFSAALAHRIRLAVANEFVVELQRNAKSAPSEDPLLKLALRLPRIPPADADQLETLSAKLHSLVFGPSHGQRGPSEQSLSDARHLAHAALSRASAFVTRDKALLDARDDLLRVVGIDVVDLKDLVELLPDDLEDDTNQGAVFGKGFIVGDVKTEELRAHLENRQVQDAMITEFCSHQSTLVEISNVAIRLKQKIAAVGSLAVPKTMEPVAKMLICADPEHPEFELFSDYLMDSLTRKACNNGPMALELMYLPGQSMAHSLARSRGFVRSPSSNTLEKIALGRPITQSSWASITKQLWRRTGLKLPQNIPVGPSTSMTLTNRDGLSFEAQAFELENILSPTLVITQGRDGALVPIRRKFADELLGTNMQTNFSFIEGKDAAFVATKCYVNSPRTAATMKPERPILFYESLPDGGRGAVIACARIIDAVVMQKGDIPNDRIRRLVVDDVDEFSSSHEVLLTTFDTLFEFPKSVPLTKLRALGAIDGSNLVSATTIGSDLVSKIIDWGWRNE